VHTDRRLAAIVAADVVGYSRLMGVDETGTLLTLRNHRDELIDPLIADHRGRIVKVMGDGLLLEFKSIVDAVNCALEIQRGMIQRNQGKDQVGALRYRIGIHLGDVIVEEGDIFGDGVNVAARVEALADPDGIAVTEDAHRQIRDRIEVDWHEGGEHRVKNIVRPISVWRWVPEGARMQPRPATQAEVLARAEGPSIAVVPFENRSQDPEQDYFSDGITDDIVTELSKLPGILVISRNSTIAYTSKALHSGDICRDLGVRYMLQGSVRKAGGRVRITAQLIDGRSDSHVWAERYDRELIDVFEVQDDVTTNIVEALEIQLIARSVETLGRDDVSNTEAYDSVLRGRQQFRLYTTNSHIEAAHHYERAIEIDPNYAAAYAGLAMTKLHEWFHGTLSALDEAYEIARTAQSLNPTLPAVYEALGNICNFRRDHEQAVSAARQLARIEPGNPDVYANLAAALHLSGENQAAIPIISKAIELNPTCPFYYFLYRGMALLLTRRYEEALVDIERSVSRNPDALPAHLYHASCLGHLSRHNAAGAALADVLRLNPKANAEFVRRHWTYKNAADADHLIDGLRIAGLAD
jgi:adenylate cyclase